MLRSPLVAIFLSVAAVPLFAQQGDAPPVDAAALLKTLEVLETKQSSSSEAQFGRVLQSLGQAGSSNGAAIQLYEDAVKATRFMGLSMEQTKFQEWKKKEADKLKGDAMQNAARLHIRYLVLTLQFTKGTPVDGLVDALIQYGTDLESVTEKVPDAEKEELLRKSVAEGIIAKWYGVGPQIRTVKGWELVPGNLDGIYGKTLLPWMREKKDPRLIAYWDARIVREARKIDPKQQDRKPTQFQIDQFNFVEKPSLLWSRSEDILALGQKNRAITEMFNIAKAYPDHPDNAKWLKRLRELLSEGNAG